MLAEKLSVVRGEAVNVTMEIKKASIRAHVLQQNINQIINK